MRDSLQLFSESQYVHRCLSSNFNVVSLHRMCRCHLWRHTTAHLVSLKLMASFSSRDNKIVRPLLFFFSFFLKLLFQRAHSVDLINTRKGENPTEPVTDSC